MPILFPPIHSACGKFSQSQYLNFRALLLKFCYDLAKPLLVDISLGIRICYEEDIFLVKLSVIEYI
ncbi:MAG TPA: hypothetical protein VJB08_06430 [Candidatus Nanoarchaeia archaeon]|nr:hypothetical protein [Candidatus Nanoarchaeia archaeon]